MSRSSLILASLALVALLDCRGETASRTPPVAEADPPAVSAAPVAVDTPAPIELPRYSLPSVTKASRILSVTLMDSVLAPHWNPMSEIGMQTYRLILTSDSGVDTVPNVLEPRMALAGDTVAVALAFDSTTITRHLLRVRAGQPPVALHLPHDLWAFFHDLALSPDGRYILLLAYDPPAYERFVVYDLASGERVWESAPHPVCECDVDLHHARWSVVDTFAYAWQVPESRAWELVTATVRGVLRTDTLPDEPQWHSP